MNMKTTGVIAALSLKTLFPIVLLCAVPLLFMKNDEEAETQKENPNNPFSLTPQKTLLSKLGKEKSKPVALNNVVEDSGKISPSKITLRRGDSFVCPDTGITLQVRAMGKKSARPNASASA